MASNEEAEDVNMASNEELEDNEEAEDVNMASNEETEDNEEAEDDAISLSDESTTSQITPKSIQGHISKLPLKKSTRSWNDRYLQQFSWIRYDAEKRIASCKLRLCKTYNSFR